MPSKQRKLSDDASQNASEGLTGQPFFVVEKEIVPDASFYGGVNQFCVLPVQECIDVSSCEGASPDFSLERETCYSDAVSHNTYCSEPLTPKVQAQHTTLNSSDDVLGMPALRDHYDDSSDSEGEDEPCPTSSLSTHQHSFQTKSAYFASPQYTSELQVIETTETVESACSATSIVNSANVGMMSYIVEPDGAENLPTRCQVTASQPSTTPSRQAKKKQPDPWYKVSRPISEQTRNIKIRSVNRSSSIHFSKLLEKCRSIMEYCTLQTDETEPTAENVTDMNHNYNWGDSLPKNAKGNTIRVVYQNVHRSIAASDSPHTNNLLANLHSMEADVFMATESNLNWKSAMNRNAFNSKVSKIWQANRTAFSSSDVGLDFEFHEFLPGGTCTMVVDNLSMRVVKVGEDESGLGRWSYVTLEGQDGHKVTFITAYRICQGAMKGASTSCMQQMKVLNSQEMKKGQRTSTPDTNFLRTKFIDDIFLFIQMLKEAGHAIVLGVDANETPAEATDKNGQIKPGSISWLFEQTGLVEVFHAHHKITPDSMTTTPGRFIDGVAVYGIPIQRVTLLHANFPAKSDHLGIALDLDLQYLFRNACSPLVRQSPRKLNSNNLAVVQKYIGFIKKQFAEHKIFERCQYLRSLSETGVFEDHHRTLLYSLDRQITEISLGAENQCSNKRAYRNFWSPALQKAGKEIGYWKQRINFNGLLPVNTKDLGDTLGIPLLLQAPMTIELCQFYHSIAWKSYRGIQSQARLYREKFLNQRAKELAEKGNGDVARAVRQIKHRERLKKDYADIRKGYGISKQGLATLDTPDPTTGGRQLITNAEEIHNYLLRRNEKHFSQATFTTFGDVGPGFKYINPDDPESDEHIDAILEGTFEPWASASPNVCEFLKELKCVVTAEMNTALSFEAFKQLFKTIPENTGSSISGLHYGHYRVLSKMEDDSIIRVLFDLVNIAFVTHSPLPRWKYATQLMLEKGKGPAIENLRIIQILEADMNWLLRFLWGRELERHAVAAGAYNEGQFASPGKLCQSAIVNKVLFFDLLRQTRQYGGLVDNDATAAFDRVLPALCVITCRQLGMPKEAQRFFFRLLRQMEYTTTTAHGRSSATYSAADHSKAPGQGVMQGGGASLTNYKSQQLPVLRAYEHNCTPAIFRQVSKLQTSFRRWVSGFSDDVGLFLNELGVLRSGRHSDLPVAQRVQKVLQTNLSKYEEYFFTAGGALNVKKCFYYFIGFKWTGTEWRYCDNAEMEVDQILITPTTLDNMGMEQPVQWYEANEAQRTLGSFLAPDGSCIKQMEILYGKLSDWQQCLRNLTNVQAKWLSFRTVFAKKCLYPLIGHSCSQADLQPIQKVVDREVLHLLSLNEHFPRAALYAPMKYGGMGCVSLHGQHVIEKLILFLHHMREGGRMRETLPASMGITQLECGSQEPFFDLPATKWYDFVTPTWITHIWRECQLAGIDIKFHPLEFWVPKPVRTNDECIMTVASHFYDGESLRKINMCRIHLKVTFLSDIAAVDGRKILYNYYAGNKHQMSGRRSRLNWPPVGDLPKSWWSLWREFLCKWCGTALKIKKPLGGWFDKAEMITQCCFFRYGRRLIMQHDECFYEFLPVNHRARTRYENRALPFTDVDLLKDAQVVDVAFKPRCIYVVAWSEQNIIESSTTDLSARGNLRDLYENLPLELQRMIGNVNWPPVSEFVSIVQSIQEGTAVAVSDGSVRIDDNAATHAWIIQAEDGSEITGKGPVDGIIEPRTIHRAELQGQTAIFLMLTLLVKCAGIIGGKIISFCDNKAVVEKMQRGWQVWRYRNTKGADGDLQAQLRQTLHDLQATKDITYETQWVKGHQDNNGNINSLSQQGTLNVRMDNDTKQAYLLPQKWRSQRDIPVFRSEGCAVYIGDRKITHNLHSNLCERWHEDAAKTYLLQRHKIDADLFSVVYWQAMRYGLSKLRPHKRAMAVKAIHRHLPTQEKLFKQGRVTMSSLCPRCLHSAETNSHIFNCTDSDAITQRKKDWMDLWKALHKNKTATVIEQVWRIHLQPIIGIPLGDSIIDGLKLAHGELEALLQLAIDEQSQIGWEKLLLGFGTITWKTIQELVDAGNPKRPQRTGAVWMNTAIHQMIKFSVRCWKQRNATVHGATRQEKQQKALQAARDKIRAIYADPPSLAPQFRTIFTVLLEHRLKMSLNAAEHWLSTIAHQVKVTQHNWSVLLRHHLPMTSHLRSMRRIARNQAKERSQPINSLTARSRQVQAATKLMKEKLYAKKTILKRPRLPSKFRSNRSGRGSGLHILQGQQLLSRGEFPLRYHPP